MKRTEKCISFVATQILTLTAGIVKQRHTFTKESVSRIRVNMKICCRKNNLPHFKRKINIKYKITPQSKPTVLPAPLSGGAQKSIHQLS